MNRIAILSSHYEINFRGAEIWTKVLKEKLKNSFDIEVYNVIWRDYQKIFSADVIIPIDGRFQVFITRFLTWFNKKPMIVFGHSGLGADDKWNLLCSPNVFVVFSDYQKNWAEKYKLPWTKVIKISHAVDLTKFTPSVKKTHNKTVLCVAANTPDKRVDLVRKAVELIPGAKFIAVGKGNSTEVPFNEMPEIYKKADVFCFVPQPWEAFGLVFLEAMATNIPIITINDPVRREIVGDAGIFVDNPEDAEDLAQAIDTTLKTNWGNKPRRQAEKFSWDKIRIKYEELFKL